MEKWGHALQVVGVGFYVVICLIGGIIGGNWLDNKFNTRPIFLLAGVVLSLILVFWGIYQMLLPIISDKKERR